MPFVSMGMACQLISGCHVQGKMLLDGLALLRMKQSCLLYGGGEGCAGGEVWGMCFETGDTGKFLDGKDGKTMITALLFSAPHMRSGGVLFNYACFERMGRCYLITHLYHHKEGFSPLTNVFLKLFRCPMFIERKRRPIVIGHGEQCLSDQVAIPPTSASSLPF